MTLIVRPFTYTAGNKIKATENTSNETTLYTCVNGNIGEANVTYVTANDGMRVFRAGPNAGGANGFRIALLSRASIALGAATSGSVVFTFSTDAIYGNPAFEAAPTPVASGVVVISTGAAADTPHHMWISSLTNTAATVQWVRAAGGANTVTFQLWVGGDV